MTELAIEYDKDRVRNKLKGRGGNVGQIAAINQIVNGRDTIDRFPSADCTALTAGIISLSHVRVSTALTGRKFALPGIRGA